MLTLPQTDTISNIKNNHDAVLAKLDNGPVLVMQRSRPAAVLVSVMEWDRVARRLAELEERELVRQRQRSPRLHDVSLDAFVTDLMEQGVSNA